MSRTYAIVPVSGSTFANIKRELEKAGGYDDAISYGGSVIDMHGLAIESEREPKDFHPSVQGVLQFFHYEHLPPKLQAVSMPFCEMALDLAYGLPSNAETTVALRNLLLAKDAAVRSLLFK